MYIKRRIITLCNTNSWHFNSHFGWYFYFFLTRWSLFIRHKTLPFSGRDSLRYFSWVTAKLHKKNFSLYVFFFWLLELFMGQLCKISLRGRFYSYFLRSCFTTLSMDQKWFLSFSWPLSKNQIFSRHWIFILFTKILCLLLRNIFLQKSTEKSRGNSSHSTKSFRKKSLKIFFTLFWF